MPNLKILKIVTDQQGGKFIILEYKKLRSAHIADINSDISFCNKGLMVETCPITINALKEAKQLLNAEYNRRASFIPTPKLMFDLNYFYDPKINIK